LLTVEDGACGYAATRIIDHINVSIGPLDRIALLGPNGAGKSTLTRMLRALLRRSRPAHSAADLNVGYFAQQQMEQLQPDCDAFWHVRNLGGPDLAKGEEQRVRDHLADSVSKAIGRSNRWPIFRRREGAPDTGVAGGARPNLLLLDEPTIISTSTCATPSASRCKASRVAW